LDEPEEVLTLTTQFSVSFDGANRVAPVGLDRAETVFNYYLGDQSNWHSNVPGYETVAYPGLYDGIDLLTFGRRDSLKYEFHVAPGADWRAIQISYEGIEGLWLDDGGALHVEAKKGTGPICRNGPEGASHKLDLSPFSGVAEGDSPIFAAQKSGQSPGQESGQSPWGELIDEAPFIYQMIAGQQVEVSGAFKLLDADTYTFEVSGPYDPSLELIIDPELAWSTYLGGSDIDGGSDMVHRGDGIAVDAAGNVLVTGRTESSGWTAGGYDTTHNGGGADAFVAKLSTNGGHLWSTYLGGNNLDWGDGIAVDAAGNVLVTGRTQSSGWTAGGYNTTHTGGGPDAFVAKLGPNGGHLWSTYLGGSDFDYGDGIAVDALGNVLVAGRTESSGWVAGGYDSTYNGGSRDAFVAKLGPNGGHLWSTYLGGNNRDWGYGIAVDASGNALVTGRTDESSGWTAGGYNTTYNGGGADAFVAKLGPNGGHLWSTYLGGNNWDWGYGIAVDASGNALVTGGTESSGWTEGGYDRTHNGRCDAFVAKLGPSGAHLWSTYLGGSHYDHGSGIAVDASGNALVTGDTYSSGWAIGGHDTTYNGSRDAFVIKLSTSGTHLWSTYLGGNGWEKGNGIAVDASGNALVSGPTWSSGWTSDGYDTTHNGSGDVFVAKITDFAPIIDAVVFWDESGDGDWSDPGRWVNSEGDPVGRIPDETLSVIVSSDTVTIPPGLTLRKLTVESGAIVLPPGAVLTVEENVDFAPDATLVCQVEGAAFGRIDAGGSVELGGTLEIQPLGVSGAALGSIRTQTILTAAGGVTGQFDSLPPLHGFRRGPSRRLRQRPGYEHRLFPDEPAGRSGRSILGPRRHGRRADRSRRRLCGPGGPRRSAGPLHLRLCRRLCPNARPDRRPTAGRSPRAAHLLQPLRLRRAGFRNGHRRRRSDRRR